MQWKPDPLCALFKVKPQLLCKTSVHACACIESSTIYNTRLLFETWRLFMGSKKYGSHSCTYFSPGTEKDPVTGKPIVILESHLSTTLMI